MALDTRIDPRTFRAVLGEFPTGVVVVTALSADGEPLGMTIGSFTSVSIDPPLVAFLPSKTSSSWAALRSTGVSFAVNFLAAHQQDVGAAVALRKADKLADIAWEPSAWGNPHIVGAAGVVDCEVVAIHDGGDHDIVLARVTDLSRPPTASPPLIFHRGSYSTVSSA
ncbi:flavin reductase [Mycolicibacterium sp. P9-64]|uniref:flavin reductase family protein n=1 Tax=Mycolicibacterium sp. P9-64 TaxID=2024612 RepID=UPI0011EEBE46|nr:flavin reductase family protein [Mycolicibacterium sp. P9-64]KAA0085612.1 flavin reductase [Mycolicibacterium sp. P9-64]